MVSFKTEMSEKLTSIDIARLAGVSQTSVSLVLRNKWEGRIRKETADKILKVCEENNYSANRVAALLKSGKSRNIALIVPDSENPFFSRILHSLRQETIAKGYECMLVETENSSNWYDYVENAIRSNEISYAISLYNNLEKLSPSIADRFISVNDVPAEANSIMIDFYSAAYKAVNLLADAGYEHIIHIRPSLEKATFTARINGFNDACSKRGIFHYDIIPTGHIHHNIYELLTEKKKSLRYPQGIVIDDDLFANGVYNFAGDNGLKIGKDIGIISMDDTFLCNWVSPHLSSFGFNMNMLVKTIMDMVASSEKSDFRKVKIEMNINSFRSF